MNHSRLNYNKYSAQERRQLMRYAQNGIVPAGVDLEAARERSRELARWEEDPTGQKGKNQMNNNNHQQPRRPATVDELFPSSWLSVDDLRGRPYTLTIANVEFDLFPVHPRTQEKTTKAVIRFEKAQKALILNQTQARQIEEICRSGAFKDWPGTRVTLSPGRAPNGKPTITIGKPPAETMPIPNQTQARTTAATPPAEDQGNEEERTAVPQKREEDPAAEDQKPRRYRFVDGAVVPDSHIEDFHYYKLVNGSIPHNLGQLRLWLSAGDAATEREEDPGSPGRYANGTDVPAALREFYEDYLEAHAGELPQDGKQLREWVRSTS